MTKADLLRDGTDVAEDAFPDRLPTGPWELPLDYKFEPGQPHDGITVTVPLEGLNQVDAESLAWLVPGLLQEKVLAMIRRCPRSCGRASCPRPKRRSGPWPSSILAKETCGPQLARALSRIGGVEVSAGDFNDKQLPPELQMNVHVTDAEGRTVAAGRDLETLRRQLGAEATAAFTAIDDPCWNRDGLTGWDFDELPAEIDVAHGRMALKAYPALVDREKSVALRLLDSPLCAAHETRFALRRPSAGCLGRSENAGRLVAGAGSGAVAGALVEGFEMHEQLALLLAARAWPDEVELPRTKAAFERRRRSRPADRPGGAGSGRPDWAMARGLLRGHRTALDAAGR